MEESNQIHRRQWLKLGLGLAAGTMGTAFTIVKINDKDEKCLITPKQELGPFPPMKARSQPDHDIDLTHVQGQAGTATGEIIVVQGKILDTDCNPVEGAVVEIWQSNHYGKYNHEFDPKGQHDPNFQGWGQALTNKDGQYRFTTILPGLYARRTRHIHFKIAKRGYHEMVTQMYFDGEERNKTDGLLNALTHAEQLKLICKLNKTAEHPTIEFNINVEKLKENEVPAKVLAQYTGQYHFQSKGTQVDELINQFLGGPYEKILMKVEQEENLLFFTLPFAPRTEAKWKEKDIFNAASFFQADLRFVRDDAGNINGVQFNWKDGMEWKGTRV